jgi:hypothetical protein
MSTGKRVIPPFQVMIAADLAGNVTSSETDVMGLDYARYDIAWSGTAPIGVMTVEYLKDGDATWATLDVGTIAVSGASGTHEILFTELPFKRIRLKYTRTSGTGTMNAYITAKEG